jgi:hypothetical protein
MRLSEIAGISELHAPRVGSSYYHVNRHGTLFHGMAKFVVKKLIGINDSLVYYVEVESKNNNDELYTKHVKSDEFNRSYFDSEEKAWAYHKKYLEGEIKREEDQISKYQSKVFDVDKIIHDLCTGILESSKESDFPFIDKKEIINFISPCHLCKISHNCSVAFKNESICVVDEKYYLDTEAKDLNQHISYCIEESKVRAYQRFEKFEEGKNNGSEGL